MWLRREESGEVGCRSGGGRTSGKRLAARPGRIILFPIEPPVLENVPSGIVQRNNQLPVERYS